MMCVCDNLNNELNEKWIEWMWRVDVESGLSGCGKWMCMESGAVPDLTR